MLGRGKAIAAADTCSTKAEDAERKIRATTFRGMSLASHGL